MFMILICLIGWSTLFLLLQKFFKDDMTFNNYVVSFTHAFVIGRCCEIVWYIEQTMKLDQFGSDLTLPQYCVLSLSTGYLIYDTIICLYNRDEFAYVVHHVLSFLVLFAPILTLKSGAEVIFCLWYCELSGPFLHLRFFIEQSIYKHSTIAVINECVFAFLFVSCRYGLGLWTLYKLYWSPESLLMVKMFTLIFFFFNQYIFYMMCMRAKSVLGSVYENRYKTSKHK